MSDWQTQSSEIVYETPWIKVRKNKVINNTGTLQNYSYIEMQNQSVVIIAINNQNQIFIQRNYRYPSRERSWEIPAGYIDAGEEPQATAKRELIEEAGLVSDNWTPLGMRREFVGNGDVQMHIFLAKDVQPSGEPTDKDEDITDRKFVGLSEIESMISDGTINDAAVIAAIYMAKLHGLETTQETTT